MGVFFGRGLPFLLKYFSKILVKSYASASRLLLEITGSCNIIYNAKIKNTTENLKDAVKVCTLVNCGIIFSIKLKQKNKHYRSLFDHYDEVDISVSNVVPPL